MAKYWKRCNSSVSAAAAAAVGKCN